MLYTVNTQALLWQGDLGATRGANETQVLALQGRVLQGSTMVEQDPVWAPSLLWLRP